MMLQATFTLDTSILDSSAIYTYTAGPDGAGNLGESVNLTVVVISPTQHGGLLQ